MTSIFFSNTKLICLWGCCLLVSLVELWFIILIRPPYCVGTDINWYALTSLTSATYHSLIACDWWGDQWPIPDHRWREYWIRGDCRVTLKDWVNLQGLPKLSGPSSFTSQGKYYMKNTVACREWPQVLWSILCNPLLSSKIWCVWMDMLSWICPHYDSSVFSLAQHKGLTPLWQNDAATICDALPWQQVCVVNDS